MDEKLIKNLLDILPQYINFAIRFLRSPGKAFEAYKGIGQVHSDLTSFLFAGVGAAYLLVILIPIEGLNIQEPQGATDWFAQWLTKQDPKLLPLQTLMAVLVLVLVAHFIAKAFDRWEKLVSRKPELNIPGVAEDSVNAALGFIAVILPLTIALFSLTLHVANSPTASRFEQITVFLVAEGVLIFSALVAICYYLVMSFAAVHDVSYRRAASALGPAFLAIYALIWFLA